MKVITLVLALLGLSKIEVDRDRLKINAPYDGERFLNLDSYDEKGLLDVIKWKLGSLKYSEKWPTYKNYKTFKIENERSKNLNIVVINHATILIQIDNINILTDPVYSMRTSPFQWIGPKRVRNPAVSYDDLPPIDIVLISHNHYDHLDLDSLFLLEKDHDPLILAGLGTRSFLKQNGFSKVKDLDWWESETFKGIEFIFTPARHFSSRGILDNRKMLWGGFFIKSSAESVYFAGDTGYGRHYELIREKIGIPDISLLPIGAYKPRDFMRDIHMNPDDAVKAFLDLGSSVAIGMHFGTFKLTDEGIDTPIKELQIALKKYNVKSRFLIPEFGKGYSLKSEVD